MIKTKLHIVLISLLSILLFAGLYLFFKASISDFVQVNISTKSLNNTENQLIYSNSDLKDKSNIKIERNTIMASQFYKNYSYYVNDFEHVKEMVFYLGDTANTIFVDKITFVHFVNSTKDTLYQWSPMDSISNLFIVFNNAILASHTSRYIEIQSTKEGARTHLNFEEVLKRHTVKNNYILQSKLLLASFLITFFIILTIVKAPAGVAKMRFDVSWSSTSFLVYAFAIVIFIFFLNSIVRLIPDMPNRENRTLSQLPKLNPKTFFVYPEQFNTYTDEHYAFRNRLFFVNSILHAKLLRESSLADKVILGKKYWFFHNEENSINDFRRLTKIDTAEINNVIRIMNSRIQWLKNRNIKYYIITPPNKERIYPEFMPDAYFKVNNYGHNRLDFYKEYIKANTKAIIIDPTDSLYEAKKYKDVYYSTDTHWNLYGGFIGYHCFMNELIKDFPMVKPVPEKDFIISEQFISEGDLASMLALQNIYRRKEYAFTFIDTNKKLLPSSPSEIVLRYTNNKTVDSSNLKLVMFRDSYSNYLIPFFNLHFKQATYIWNYEFMSEVIDQEKPDVVVFESLERFMAYALTIPNTPMMDLEVKQKNSY